MYKSESAVYLDNAATTFPKPPCVMRAVRDTVLHHGGNPGRSAHRLAMEAADAVFCAREAVAELLHICAPERVVFTMNATYALNMSIKCAIKAPCHVLISDLEHNAVVRPLEALREAGRIEYSVFSTKGDVHENILRALKRNTRMLVCTLASNICGREVPIELLSDIRREKGLYTVVDASQLLGHADISLDAHPVDALCAPAHKGLFGIQGCGIAVFPMQPPSETWAQGGSGSESRSRSMPTALPERLEAGTLPTPSIAALGAGIRYIESCGLEAIEEHLSQLTEQLTRGLGRLGHLRTVDTAGHGIVSVLHDRLSPERLAAELDREGICVRAGLQCAPLAHETVGTADTGTLRISLSQLNTSEEIDILLRALFRLT